MIQEMNNERGKNVNWKHTRNIKRLRKKIGLTQKECAEILAWLRELGVARKNLSEL